MTPTRVVRETLIEESVQAFIADALFTQRGLPSSEIELRESFDQAEFEGEIDKNFVALGFNYDDGGVVAEMGSTLRRREYKIEVFVVALAPDKGSNIAYTIRDAIEDVGAIPLHDYTQDGAPVIDYLIVDPISVHRQPIPDPEPWQRFVWLVTIPLIDETYA